LPAIANALFLAVMKYKEGQQVSLLTLEGKPAAGSAVVVSVDEVNEYYTVQHYLHEDAEPTLIDKVVEGRLITFADFV
jgi:hypothetical protein